MSTVDRRTVHNWYSSARWRKRAALQLREHPLCAMCLALPERKVTVAKIADHITPHRGDKVAFFTGAIQSLCAPCHSSTKAQLERKGYVNDVAGDGQPIDRNHWWWQS